MLWYHKTFRHFPSCKMFITNVLWLKCAQMFNCSKTSFKQTSSFIYYTSENVLKLTKYLKFCIDGNM